MSETTAVSGPRHENVTGEDVTGRWGPLLATQKSINRPGWWERKSDLCQMTATWRWGGWPSVQRPTPHTASQWVRTFYINRRRGLHAETARSALIVIFKLVPGGLMTSHHFVWGRVNLQFVCCHFFEAKSQNCSTFCHSYGLVSM